jgi:hypothetical protein
VYVNGTHFDSNVRKAALECYVDIAVGRFTLKGNFDLTL